MVIITSWLVLLVGLSLSAWYFWIRSRGSLHYWIRGYDQGEKWLLGKTLPMSTSAAERRDLLSAVNAEVRTLDQRVTTVVRQWDHQAETLFLGVILREELVGAVPEGFELKKWEPKKVVRLSGDNRLDERSQSELLNDYLTRKGVSLVREKPMQLTGQSFALYQWEISDGTIESSSEAEEGTFQLRDNFVLPVIGLIVTLGLLGTREPILFAMGVCLIVFLSGVCKFIFLPQRTDEADEVHLQNY